MWECCDWLFLINMFQDCVNHASLTLAFCDNQNIKCLCLLWIQLWVLKHVQRRYARPILHKAFRKLKKNDRGHSRCEQVICLLMTSSDLVDVHVLDPHCKYLTRGKKRVLKARMPHQEKAVVVSWISLNSRCNISLKLTVALFCGGSRKSSYTNSQ